MDAGAEERYTISEIAKMMGIEQSVLRSTEKQLGLEIPRSEGNRRYYREAEVTLLKDVQKLREEGFTFRMIKLLLPKLSEVLELKTEERRSLRLKMKKILADMQAEEEEEDTSVAKIPNGEPVEGTEENGQAYAVFGTVMTELLTQNNKALLEEMDTRIAQRIMKEMNYLFRERESLEEERYRKLDRTIREYQAARQQTAIEEERRGFFRRGSGRK
ncbi:MAG: MerR family transcriptional regulator [Lachnospiraceae bacterium]